MIWSYVVLSMKTKSAPSLYRNCMSRLSTVAVSTLVPALNVLSTTLPDSTCLSLVRTKAGPLPGLTCWNSTTVQSCPSRLSTMPFFRSLVDATWSLSLTGRSAGTMPPARFVRWGLETNTQYLRAIVAGSHHLGFRPVRDRAVTRSAQPDPERERRRTRQAERRWLR